MKQFKVETLHENTGGYEGVITFKPDYIVSVMKFRKRWWWPWGKKEIGVIMNLRDAEKVSLGQALHHAQTLQKKVPTQVKIETVIGGTKSSEVVWQNGHVIDLSIWPKWRRFLAWLLRYKPPQVKRSK